MSSAHTVWYPQRSGLRYIFTASVRVVDPKSGKQVISITSNLSRSGCHVRTSTPFEAGTKIEITIKHRGVTFHYDAEVVYAIAGAGMGIRFENDRAEEESLDGWLVQIRDEAIEHRPERVYKAASQRKIILVACITALAIIAAATLAWFGML